MGLIVTIYINNLVLLIEWYREFSKHITILPYLSHTKYYATDHFIDVVNMAERLGNILKATQQGTGRVTFIILQPTVSMSCPDLLILSSNVNI